MLPLEGKAVPLDHMALTLAMLNLPMRFVRQAGLSCRRGAESLECEEGKVWREEPEGEGTYRPFEGLDVLMKNLPKQ